MIALREHCRCPSLVLDRVPPAYKFYLYLSSRITRQIRLKQKRFLKEGMRTLDHSNTATALWNLSRYDRRVSLCLPV